MVTGGYPEKGPMMQSFDIFLAVNDSGHLVPTMLSMYASDEK